MVTRTLHLNDDVNAFLERLAESKKKQTAASRARRADQYAIETASSSTS